MFGRYRGEAKREVGRGEDHRGVTATNMIRARASMLRALSVVGVVFGRGVLVVSVSVDRVVNEVLGELSGAWNEQVELQEGDTKEEAFHQGDVILSGAL